jgi:hypothetical protein
MATLADINETLQSNQKLAEDTNKNISEMKVGILGFFDFEKRKRLDDLEASREKKNNQAAAISSATQEGKKDGVDGEFGFGNIGNFLGGLGFCKLLSGAGKLFSLAFLARIFKRGIFGTIAVMLADEIASGVKALTGSDLAGALTEAGIVGGGLGAMFGPKGIIIGAMAGVITTSAKAFGDYVEEELKKQDIDFAPIIGEAAGATTNIAGFATVGGLVLGPLGAIAGAIIGGSVSLFQTYQRYQNDPEFKKLVDEKAANIKKNVEDSIIAAGNFILDSLDKIAPDLITTKDEKDAFRQAKPERAKLLDETQKEVNILARKKLYEPESFSEIDRKKLTASTALLSELRAERDAFLNSDNRDAMLRRGSSQGGMTAEQAAEAFGAKTTKADIKTADEIIKFVAVKRDKERKIDSFTRGLKGRALESSLSRQFGISDMTKIKELAKEMNMSLIDYFEKYRTVGVNTTPPAVVDASVTNVGSATTALVGSGTNSFDANNPLVRRAMEAVVL